jgi:tetratricopeptide (TPR) repeat protein
VAAAAALVVLASSVFVYVETSRQRSEERRIAIERFKPVEQAMELSSLHDWTHYEPWTWSLEADIRDPSGHMLCALLRLESGRPENAIGCLRECLERCKQRNDRSLERDVHYLLGISAQALSGRTDTTPERREQLHREAQSELRAAGEFDFMCPDAFVWRGATPNDTAAGRAPPSISDIKINSEHYLARTFVGLYLFFDLYKGGDVGEFYRTIECFNEVLKQRPENAVALTFLGRTHYFLAEHFDFLNEAETAESYLNRALASAGEDANHIIHATLGSVHLLQGHLRTAMTCYEDAIEATTGQYRINIHNALAGIGAVYARQGRIEEALDKYREALAIQGDDVPIKVALTELHLARGETEEALRYAEQATQRGRRSAFLRGVTQPASAYLASARTHLARGEYTEAARALDELYEFTIFSVRDFSLACILIATFPEGRLHEDDGKATRLMTLANLLAEGVSTEAQWGERISPISLSATGANAYLRGRYEDAVDALHRAMQEREKWWPEEVHNYIWTDDARDQYLLAMAHFRLAGESADDREIHEEKARAYYEKAEQAYRTRTRRFGVIDVIDRIRARAGEVLGVAQQR